MLHALLADKPKVPKFTPVDIGAEQEAAVREQRELLPSLSEFASEFNRLSAEQMLSQLERMMPGYGALLSRGTQTVGSLLRGEVPEDVENRLERMSAERGVSIGTSGSGFGENQFLRNLGLTSLNLIQQGLDSASRWMSLGAASAPTFNMASAFLPIGQRIALRGQESQFKFGRDWMRNQIAAIPSGAEAALITLADNIEQVGRSVLTSYAGSLMGGGGGGSQPAVSDSWQGMSGLQFQQSPQFGRYAGTPGLDY